MDYNTNQEVFSAAAPPRVYYDGDVVKHLQPVLAITTPPYPY